MKKNLVTLSKTYDMWHKRVLSLLLSVVMVVGMIPILSLPVSAATFNKEYSLSGSSADKMVIIAEAQIGRSMSTMGYSDSWCARFVSDVAELASENSAIPYNAGCRQLYNAIKTSGGTDISSPTKGDIVFWVCSKCKVSPYNNAYCHVGIMLNGTECISGNYNNKVARHKVTSYNDGEHNMSNGLTAIYIRPNYSNNQGGGTSAPQVTQITASAKYAKVGDSVTFSFPAYNATKYEFVITNTTTGERIQYTMLDSSSFTQIFWSEGLHLVQVNAYGTEIVGFDDFYFEVHSGNRPNTYVGGKNEDWCFTPQELTILHDAPMQEQIVEAVLNYYKDGTLWYTGSIIDTGLYTTYFYPGAYEGNILLTYESGYSVYTKTRCWYVGEKPSDAVITASSTMPKVGDTVTFTLNATGGTEHCICIGDGNEEIFKSLTSSCTYQFTKAGTYYIYGLARNAYGEIYPEAVTITVGEKPSGAVITASSTMPKVGDTVTFTLNATGGTEHCICIGDGNEEIFKSLTSSCTYQFTKAGTYYIYGWTRNVYGTTYPDPVTLVVEDNTVSVGGISLDKSTATIDVGDILNLTATVSPSNATNKAVTWTSSDSSVATVTNGTVTALKTGTTTITATTVDGSKTATCVVTVEDPNYAISGARYEVIGVTGTVGTTVEVYVSIADNPGIVSLRNTITYDTSALELISVQDCGLLKGYTTPSATISSPYTLRWADSLATQNNMSNGRVVKLIFQIKDDVEADSYNVSVAPVEARNVNGTKVTFSGASATVNVVDYVVGDTDGDGEVSDWDAIILNRYLAGWNVEIELAAADVDGDDEVTDWDAIVLERYLAGWNVELES